MGVPGELDAESAPGGPVLRWVLMLVPQKALPSLSLGAATVTVLCSGRGGLSPAATAHSTDVEARGQGGPRRRRCWRGLLGSLLCP